MNSGFSLIINSLVLICLQDPVSIYVRPANTGNKVYDALMNDAFEVYEFSVKMKKKALKEKILSHEELTDIKKNKAVADSLLIQSEFLLRGIDNMHSNQPESSLYQNTKQANLVLKKAKSNFRIAVAVLEELEEPEEF